MASERENIFDRVSRKCDATYAGIGMRKIRNARVDKHSVRCGGYANMRSRAWTVAAYINYLQIT